MSGGDWKEMFRAVQTGDFALTEYYLRAGIDPNYQHPEYQASFLVESIRFDELEIAKLLIEKGADPNVKEVSGGASPMSVAQMYQNKAAIDLLSKYIK